MSRTYTACDYLAFGLAASITLAVYSFTLAPTVTLEYSGMMAVAADHMGIGPFPGYPIWHLLGHAFTELFSFVQYNDYENPAWATNFMSAFFGSLACGILALIISKGTRQYIANPAASTTGVNWIALTTSLSASLLFAFSNTMWSQSVITERHTLNLFYALFYIAFLIHWIERSQVRATEYLLAFGLGLAISVSQFFILLFPAVLIAACLNSSRKLKLPISSLLFLITLAVFMRFGLRDIPSVILMAKMVILITLVLLLFKKSRPCGLCYGLMLVGLLPFAYLPIASDLNQPMNSGYARTIEGFRHLITRGQFERLSIPNLITHSDSIIPLTKWYAGLLINQFGALTTGLALIPFLYLPKASQGLRKLMALTLVAFISFGLIALWVSQPNGVIMDTHIKKVTFIISMAIWSLWIGLNMGIIMHTLNYKPTEN